MKERPIIFGAWAIPKLLDNSKTQTRRVLKPQPFNQILVPSLVTVDTWGWLKEGRRDLAEGRLFKCPYGQVGDRLWLKESHKLTWIELNGEDWVKCEYRFEYENDGGFRYFRWLDIPLKQRARLGRIRTWGKWRPARFMYKFLARIWLEITEVRAERLQEISSKDIRAEGLTDTGIIPAKTAMLITGTDNLHDLRVELGKTEFASLWDSRNVKRGYGWGIDPFVWCISFKKLD